MFTYREGVSVLQLIAFVPALILSLILGSRHGWGRNAGWYFLILLSLLRIAGGIAQIVTVYHPTLSAFIATAVCDLIGVGPLSALLIALLSRANDNCSVKVSGIVFKLLAILSLLGVIFGIVGSTQIKISSTTFEISGWLKASVCLFLAVAVAAAGLLVFFTFNVRQIVLEERRLLIAVGLSLPFLFVRIVFSLIAVLGGNEKFNPLFGNTTIYLCMDTLMEIAIVIICIAVGLTLRTIRKAKVGQLATPQNINQPQELGVVIPAKEGQQSGVHNQGF